MDILHGSIHAATTTTAHTSGSGGIFVFIVAAAVFAGLAILGVKRNAKRRSELEQYAASAGWQFVGRDDQWALQWQRPPFNQGYDHEANNVLRGTFAERQLVAFDYSYKERTTDSKGGSSETTFHFAVCALALPAALPYLEVGPESVFARLGSVIGVHDIEIESEEFNRKFNVRSDDRKFASDVLSPRLAQTLLSLPPYHWRTDGANLVSWSKGTLQPKVFQQWFSTLSGVIDSIPAFIWHDRGVSAPTAEPSPTPAPTMPATEAPVPAPAPGPVAAPGQPALPIHTVLPGQDILPGTSSITNRSLPRLEDRMTPLWIVLGLAVLIALGLVVSYNRFVRQRNLVQESWRQVDVELTRRHDLIPNLVETVKGYAAHERTVLEAVTEARTQAQAAATGGAGPAGQAQAENALVRTLGGLFAVAENYPTLKADTNFLALQQQLGETEDRIAASRRFYNGNVRALNTRIEAFPSSIVASVGHFTKADYFQTDDPAVRAPVTVDFGSIGSAGNVPTPPTPIG